MSSKWNRPMRRFSSIQLVCRQCGEPIRSGQFGGWDHVRRLLLRDWHQAKP